MICAPLRVSAPNPQVGFRASKIPLGASAPHTAVGFRASKIRCAVAVAAAPATLYDVLGLRAGATGREIKAAYRRLARERHPDVAGAGDEFIRLHDAYATLSDPDSRARYDRGVVAMARAPQRPMPRWWGAGGSGGRPHHTWETDQCW